MFERFTERARQAVVLAQDEARGFKHNYIGAEHLLLGMLREEEGLAARVLSQFAVTLEDGRRFVREKIGEGDVALTGQIPFTPRTRKILELSLREALSLGHNYIGTEHLLLGLVREDAGQATLMLSEQGVDGLMVRDRVLKELSPAKERPVSSDEVSGKSAIMLLDEQLESYEQMLGLLTQRLAPVLRPRELRPEDDVRAWQESGLRERTRTLAELNAVLGLLLDDLDL